MACGEQLRVQHVVVLNAHMLLQHLDHSKIQRQSIGDRRTAKRVMMAEMMEKHYTISFLCPWELAGGGAWQERRTKMKTKMKPHEANEIRKGYCQ